MRVNGSIDSGGMCGSSSWLPKIVRGAISTCSVRPDASMHQYALLWDPPMTPGSLAAGGFHAGSLITPSGIWLHCMVLTGMQCGLLSSCALIVTMLLSACSEGADPICPWAVDSTCSEGQVSGQEGRGGWSQFVGHLQ